VVERYKQGWVAEMMIKLLVEFVEFKEAVEKDKGQGQDCYRFFPSCQSGD